MSESFVPSENCLITIVGKRMSGKTTEVQKLISRWYYCTRIMLVTTQKHDLPTWTRTLSKNSDIIFLDETDDSSISATKTAIGDLNRKNDFIISNLHTTVILDELPKSLMKSKEVLDLIKNCRFMGINVISILQHIGQILPEIRQNIKYLGIMMTNNMLDLRSIWSHFLCETIVSFDDFVLLVLKKTKSKGGKLWIGNQYIFDLSEEEDLEFFVRPAVVRFIIDMLPMELAQMCGDFLFLTAERRRIEARRIC